MTAAAWILMGSVLLSSIILDKLIWRRRIADLIVTQDEIPEEET